MDPATPMLVEVEELRLDPRNPRLPEQLNGASQEDLLRYLHENGALDELATSFVDNGFFAHEPLIVSRPDSDGIHDVLEGNRRLATLAILLQMDAAENLGVAFSLDPEPTPVELDRLRRVPCFVVARKDDVHRFLGFRHIGGIKTWSAEAKARYLLGEVLRTHELKPTKNAFTLVGRSVGSNAQGIRNPYIAISILMKAREEFGFNIDFIQHNRFGVWNRAMNSPELRDYIGFGDARTFEEVAAALNRLREKELREVLGDMTPKDSKRAVLGDSRDVTIYAQVLQNDQAHSVLREYEDLSLARQVVEQSSMPDRIAQIGQSIEVLNREVERQGAPSEAVEPARQLERLARSLAALVSAHADS